MANSTGSVHNTYFTLRCLPRLPWMGSTGSPALICAITVRWPGMIQKNTLALMAVAIIAPTSKKAARPEHEEERERHHDGRGRRPVHLRLVDEVGAGAVEVRHGEQRKAADPRAVAFPEEPVEVAGQLGRRHGELDRVVEPAAVHGPEFAADALFFEVFVFGRREAAVEEHEVERRAN